MGSQNIKTKCDSSQMCGTAHIIIQLENGQIAAGIDKNIQIWNVTKEDLKLFKMYMGHSGYVHSLIQLRGSNLIISGSEDKTMRLWNSLNCQCLTVIQAHFSSIASLCQVKDGRIASCSWDHTIILWNSSTFKFDILDDHTEAVTAMLELKDGRLVSGSDDNTIKFWFIKPSKGKQIKSFKTINDAHDQLVSCLLQLKDDKLASGSYDNTIKLWNIVNYECLYAYNANTEYIYSMLQLDNGYILLGTSNGSITIISSADNGLVMKMITEIIAHNDEINTLLQYKDAKAKKIKILSGSSDRYVKLWNI